MKQSTIASSVKALSYLLADTYLVYLKTQNYHWNVEDPRFSMLHLFFESQYKELADAVDDVAERIRKLNARTPASFGEFLKLSRLSEKNKVTNADQMLAELLSDHSAIIDEIRKGLKVLEKDDDEGTIDFFIERLRAHERMAWMLRSHLSGN